MKQTHFCRPLTLVLISASILFACNDDAELSTQVGSRNAAEDSVRALFEAFNAHQWTRFAGLYADTALFLDPEFGNQVVGRSHKQILDKYSEMQQMFPDIRDSVVNIFSSGGKVVAEFISSGTSPDGWKWQLPICTVFTLNNGKIVKDATYYDMEMPEAPAN